MSGIMARTVYVLMGLIVLGGSVTFAATLNNTDSLEHVLRIQEYGQGPTVRQYYGGAYGGSQYSQYRVVEHSRVEVCTYGCAMTMLTTGQTVAVNPDDTVVIDDGVLTVYPGIGQRGGW